MVESNRLSNARSFLKKEFSEASSDQDKAALLLLYAELTLKDLPRSRRGTPQKAREAARAEAIARFREVTQLADATPAQRIDGHLRAIQSLKMARKSEQVTEHRHALLKIPELPADERAEQFLRLALESKHKNEAKQFYELALALDGLSPDKRANLLRSAAYHYRANSDNSRARELYLQILNLSGAERSHRPVALSYLAELEIQEDNMDKALDYASQLSSLELVSTYQHGRLYSVGQKFKQAGHPETMAKLIEPVFRHPEVSPVTREKCGLALGEYAQSLGNFKQAHQYFESLEGSETALRQNLDLYHKEKRYEAVVDTWIAESVRLRQARASLHDQAERQELLRRSHRISQIGISLAKVYGRKETRDADLKLLRELLNVFAGNAATVRQLETEIKRVEAL